MWKYVSVCVSLSLLCQYRRREDRLQMGDKGSRNTNQSYRESTPNNQKWGGDWEGGAKEREEKENGYDKKNCRRDQRRKEHFHGIFLRLQEANLRIETMLQGFVHFDSNPDPDPTWRSVSICFSTTEKFPSFSLKTCQNSHRNAQSVTPFSSSHKQINGFL
jgi:hypothetical protein